MKTFQVLSHGLTPSAGVVSQSDSKPSVVVRIGLNQH